MIAEPKIAELYSCPNCFARGRAVQFDDRAAYYYCADCNVAWYYDDDAEEKVAEWLCDLRESIDHTGS